MVIEFRGSGCIIEGVYFIRLTLNPDPRTGACGALPEQPGDAQECAGSVQAGDFQRWRA